MLDQNTDRMWFVIGAVIVGAAIIFIANGTIPEIFASVAESFEESSEKATGIIDGLSPGSYNNLINPASVTKGAWVVVDDDTNRTTLTPGDIEREVGAGWRHTATDFMPVEGNTSYTFSSEHELVNKRMAFYDADKNYIWGDINRGRFDELTVVSPSNARYAIVSSEYIDRYTNEEVSITTWWFGKTIHR